MSSQHMTEAGAWVNGFASDERLLYRLPDVLTNPGRGVFVVEGEKDADRLAALGLIATTNPGGAASWRKHAADYAEAFGGHPQAVVITDNDADGRRWAAEVASSVDAVGCQVRVLELPGLPLGGDVSDWLDAGHTPDELKQLAKDAPQWKPPSAAEAATQPTEAQLRLVAASSVKPVRVSWAWDQRIPVGIQNDGTVGDRWHSRESDGTPETVSAEPPDDAVASVAEALHSSLVPAAVTPQLDSGALPPLLQRFQHLSRRWTAAYAGGQRRHPVRLRGGRSHAYEINTRRKGATSEG